jgi:sulfopyruvate decarboxylase TPP-binding subunit
MNVFMCMAKIMALHIQLTVEGKGVGVKSGVILEGQTPALNTKQTNNKVNKEIDS